GTWVTASAHIITAVIGSGVLSLAWAIAQMGWVAGPAVLLAFSLITYFTSTLLADSYRSPDPVNGKRNYTYSEVVRSVLAVMSFAYSSIGLGLSIAKVAGGGPPVRTSLTGVQVGVDVTGTEKVWRMFQAIGDIAFAYAYSNVLIEIQASHFIF
ncbi:amino acid permease 6-like protein, partial [Trifolium pratense]